MPSVLELFCHVDDFCQSFLPAWQAHLLGCGARKRRRARSLSESEIMTILIAFHQSHYRDFKSFYTEHVCQYGQGEFPGLVSYNRFVECVPAVLIPLFAYLRHCFGTCTGVSFIDSTALSVCHNRRIAQHQTFAQEAARGKTSVDWFFGFKLHFLVNECGELLSIAFTPGNVDDRTPVTAMLRQVRNLFGKLFGDKGYLSQALFDQLRQLFGIELVTKLKKKMKNRLMSLTDKLLLRKRAIVESIVDQLKNLSQIEHTRHRSATGLLANLACGLIAYCHQPKKPSLWHDQDEVTRALPILI
jgi:Transposase DDE domain